MVLMLENLFEPGKIKCHAMMKLIDKKVDLTESPGYICFRYSESLTT